MSHYLKLMSAVVLGIAFFFSSAQAARYAPQSDTAGVSKKANTAAYGEILVAQVRKRKRVRRRARVRRAQRRRSNRRRNRRRAAGAAAAIIGLGIAAAIANKSRAGDRGDDGYDGDQPPPHHGDGGGDPSGDGGYCDDLGYRCDQGDGGACQDLQDQCQQ